MTPGHTDPSGSGTTPIAVDDSGMFKAMCDLQDEIHNLQGYPIRSEVWDMRSDPEEGIRIIGWTKWLPDNSRAKLIYAYTFSGRIVPFRNCMTWLGEERVLP